MSNNLLIVGAGMYGNVVKETAEAMGIFDKVSFIDDMCVREDVVGKTDSIPTLVSQYKYAIVAIGNPTVRKKQFEVLKQTGYVIPTLIHPMAYISPSAQLKMGCVIEPMAVVHSYANVGEGCLICAGSVINHNACIGDFCQIDCNATVGAGVEVEADTKVMSGSFCSKK